MRWQRGEPSCALGHGDEPRTNSATAGRGWNPHPSGRRRMSTCHLWSGAYGRTQPEAPAGSPGSRGLAEFVLGLYLRRETRRAVRRLVRRATLRPPIIASPRVSCLVKAKALLL